MWWLIVGFLTLASANPPKRDGVVIYSKPNFTGRSQYLPLGAWALQNADSSAPERGIASAKIFEGYQATLFEFGNFSGIQTLPITHDIADFVLLGMSKLTSSILIERARTKKPKLKIKKTKNQNKKQKKQ